MMRRRSLWLLPPALLIAGICLLPPLLIVKQAFTPERESFAWPPTWLPADPTLENFRTLTSTVELGAGFALSLFVALLTVAASLVLALPAAWLAARRPRIDRPLDAVMIAVRLFPSVSLAIPLAAIFVYVGLYNSPAGLGLWLAHTVLGIPFAFLILRNGLRSIPVEIEEAALLDGASRAGAFWRVTMPLIRPSLAAAAMLVFLVSWDEFAYALLLQITNRPLTPLIYYLVTFGYPGLASAMATVMLLPALAVILILEPALRAGAIAGSGR